MRREQRRIQAKEDEMPKGAKTKRVTVIELSDESRKALVGVSDDITTLEAMVTELAASVQALREQIGNEATGVHPENNGQAEAVLVEDEPVESEATPKRRRKMPEMPGIMQGRGDFDTAVDDEDRIRSTPFTRTPRSVQVKWLLEVLSDGHWHSATEIADAVANDEGHRRYLRATMTHRFREMHEDNLVQRRSSRSRGSMFEYRTRPKGEPRDHPEM